MSKQASRPASCGCDVAWCIVFRRRVGIVYHVPLRRRTGGLRRADKVIQVKCRSVEGRRCRNWNWMPVGGGDQDGNWNWKPGKLAGLDLTGQAASHGHRAAAVNACPVVPQRLSRCCQPCCPPARDAHARQMLLAVGNFPSALVVGLLWDRGVAPDDGTS